MEHLSHSYNTSLQFYVYVKLSLVFKMFPWCTYFQIVVQASPL